MNWIAELPEIFFYYCPTVRHQVPVRDGLAKAIAYFSKVFILQFININSYCYPISLFLFFLLSLTLSILLSILLTYFHNHFNTHDITSIINVCLFHLIHYSPSLSLSLSLLLSVSPLYISLSNSLTLSLLSLSLSMTLSHSLTLSPSLSITLSFSLSHSHSLSLSLSRFWRKGVKSFLLGPILSDPRITTSRAKNYRFTSHLEIQCIENLEVQRFKYSFNCGTK